MVARTIAYISGSGGGLGQSFFAVCAGFSGGMQAAAQRSAARIGARRIAYEATRAATKGPSAVQFPRQRNG